MSNEVLIKLPEKVALFYSINKDETNEVTLSNKDVEKIQSFLKSNHEKYYLVSDEKYYIELEDWILLFKYDLKHCNINNCILQGTAYENTALNKFKILEQKERQLFNGEIFQYN